MRDLSSDSAIQKNPFRGVRRRRRQIAAMLVLSMTLWTIAPYHHTIHAQPVSVPALNPPAFNNGDFDPYFSAAAGADNVNDWETAVLGAQTTLATNWEFAVDAEIQGHLAAVTQSDAFHSTAEYRDYLRRELEVKKEEASAAWDLAAEAAIANERRSFLASLAAEQSDAVDATKDPSLREGESSVNKAANLDQTARADRDIEDLKAEWERKFRSEANSGLEEFANALSILEQNYQGTLLELDQQDAQFQQNLAAIEAFEDNVRTGISNTVDQMETFLNSSGMFYDGGGNLTAAGTQLQTLIADMRTSLTDGDPLSTLSQQMLTYMQQRQTDAQAEVTNWTNLSTWSSSSGDDVAIVPHPTFEATPMAVVMFVYHSGDTAPLAQVIKDTNGYGANISITINSADARGYSPVYNPPPFLPVIGGGTWMSTLPNTQQIDFAGNLSYIHSSAYYWTTDISCLPPANEWECASHLESRLEWYANWTATDANAVANANTWQGYYNDLTPVIGEWQNTILPAITNWESQRSAYEANYAAWQAEADNLRIQAGQQYVTQSASIVEQRNNWYGSMQQSYNKGLEQWDDIVTQLARKSTSLEEILAQTELASVESVSSAKLLSKTQNTFAAAASLRDRMQSDLPDTSALEDFQNATSRALNGLKNLAYASSLSEEASDLRSKAIEAVRSILAQNYVQEGRQEIDYNPYEDVPVLLRPAGWENVKATRLETDAEMQERIDEQVSMNWEVVVEEDGSVVARRKVKSGVALFGGGDLTSSDSYIAEETEQELRFGPPESMRLVESPSIFEVWDYDELEQERAQNLESYYETINARAMAAQQRKNLADVDRQKREAEFQQHAASQAKFWSMVKSVVTSMVGGMDLGSALVDYAKNQIIGQVASQIETMTGIPAGFMSSILGGANIEQAMQSYAWQVVGSHIDEVTGISGLGSQLTGMLQKQMAKKAARNGPMGKLANSMAAMTMGGGFGAMAGFMMGGPMGMLAGAAMGAATGGAMNEAGAAGFAAPMADVFYENPMLMDATAYATASATGNPGVWYGYQAMKGSYMGGTVGALTSMADSALMATQLVGVDASISYTFDDGFGGSLGFGGEYGSVGVSYSERNGVGAYGRLGSGDGLSIGFNVSEHGGNSINAGYSSGGVNLGVSYSDRTGFGANAGFGGSLGGGLNGNLGLSWSETEGIGANAGLTYGNSDLGNAMGAGLSYTQNSGLSANVSLAGATLASIAQGGNLQFNSNFASDAGRGVLKEEYIKQRKAERLDGLEKDLDEAGELSEAEKDKLAKMSPGERQAFLEKKAAEIKDRAKEFGDAASDADDYGSSWDNQGDLVGMLGSFGLGQDILNFANEVTGGNSDNIGYIDENGEFHVRTCFVAGTLVRVREDAPGAFLQDGKWFKKIEDIVIGDHVLSWNAGSQAVSFRPVTELFVHDVELIFEITYVNGTVIETTWNHPFFMPDVGWIEARHLRGGDRSLSADGGMLVIESVREVRRDERVFNFEVAENHTYFVSVDDVLVHNYINILIGAGVGAIVGGAAGAASAAAQGEDFRGYAGNIAGGAITGAATGGLVASGVGLIALVGGSAAGGAAGSVAENVIKLEPGEEINYGNLATDAVVDGAVAGIAAPLAGGSSRSASRYDLPPTSGPVLLV